MQCLASLIISFRGRGRLHPSRLVVSWEMLVNLQPLVSDEASERHKVCTVSRTGPGVQSSRRIWKVKLSPPLPVPMPWVPANQARLHALPPLPVTQRHGTAQLVRCHPPRRPRPHRTGPPAPASQPAAPSRTASGTPVPAPGTDSPAAPPWARLPRGSPPTDPLP